MTKHIISRSSLLTLAVAVLVSASSVTLADDITVDGFEYKNVRITGLRDGKLYFIGPAGERSADIVRIKGLKFSAYPELEKADKAMAKEDYRGAANIIEKTYLRLAEDYLKVIVGRKLVYTLDKSGQFEKAVQYYIPLLAIDVTEAVTGVAPRNLPTKADEKKALQSRVEGLLRAATSLEAKKYLNEILTAIKEGKEIEPDLLGPGGGLDPNAASKDIVDEAIKKKDYDKAMKIIEKQMPDRGVSLSKLLFQRGQVQQLTGKDMDALESFMRVIVHYDARQTDFYVPALVEAGKVYKKLGKSDHAKNLWTEARRLIGDDKEKRDAANEVQKLLGTL